VGARPHLSSYCPGPSSVPGTRIAPNAVRPCMLVPPRELYTVRAPNTLGGSYAAGPNDGCMGKGGVGWWWWWGGGCECGVGRGDAGTQQ
jgi:hypothetical protein